VPIEHPAPVPAHPAPARAAVAPARPISHAPPRANRRVAAKKIVVDYQSRRNEAPVPSLIAQASEDPAIARARTAYLAGNDKLFAGDAGAAITAYREALDLYPGYVAGFRGLGLAYAQLGQTKKAIDALKAYVAAAPTAKDAPLIKKRIARLQAR
ncbi:MAG TPA: tetratricopeptide repeat protein, partial [Kofleriaceae bacterium]|nr:tetratricopeptide repeat protein [Kofleriaceae bacterium]